MEHFAKYLREYWFIVIFIGMIVISWTTFSSRLLSAEERISKLEESINGIKQIEIDIAVIKEKLTNIDEKI